MAHYEIRKEGKICMSYDDERCHYSDETLKSMKQNGYKLYVDGKLYKYEKSGKSKKGGRL